MRRFRTPLAVSLAAALLLGACDGGRREKSTPPQPAERGPEFYATALASLDGVQDLAREELLATCERWHARGDGATCDAEQVRRDQLECWVEKGAPLRKYVDAQTWRPRRRAQRLLLEVDLCMERRGWKKQPGRL